MSRTLFENKFVGLYTFINMDAKPMFAIWFKVGEASDDSYRGFGRKKAKKAAKWFRKMAKELEKL